MNSHHTATVTEFAPRAEVATAIIDVRLYTGESFTGPISFGYYPDDDCPELWIEQEGRRVQFPASVLNTVIKQLKRTEKIVREGNTHGN